MKDIVITEFDEARRILHLAYRKKFHPTTKEHLDLLFASFRQLLDTYIGSGRIYLIVDMTNFIVEPELKAVYASHARAVSEKYIMPHGIARYGFQITRITVRAGYEAYITDSPNIFNSREEAFEYINSLIEKNSKESPTPAVSMTSGDCAER